MKLLVSASIHPDGQKCQCRCRNVNYRQAPSVFLTKSARRVMPRLNLAYERGFLERPIIFNTISAYLEKPQLSLILNDLLIKSSLPLVPVETVFAIDSTGVVGNRFVRWTDVKYPRPANRARPHVGVPAL